MVWMHVYITDTFYYTWFLYRYIQEWLSSLAAAGIVKVHDGNRFSLPYEESLLRAQGHAATAFPVLSENISLLEKAIRVDGPRGLLID
jgi:hypothetical protein